MDNDDLIVIDDHTTEFLNEAQFTECILNGFEDEKNILDKISDKYDKIPKFLKVFKNIDPTGIASSIDEILSENKSKREQEQIIKALYFIYNMTHQNKQNIEEAMKQNYKISSKLTEIYFQKSKETFQEEKIRYFRNIWFNGLVDLENSFDEKVYIFEIVSSLTFDQIEILKYIYDKVQQNLAYDLKNKGSAEEIPVSIIAYAKEKNKQVEYLQQICLDLQGKGLLRPGKGARISAEQNEFVPTRYIEMIIRYMSEV